MDTGEQSILGDRNVDVNPKRNSNSPSRRPSSAGRDSASRTASDTSATLTSVRLRNGDEFILGYDDADAHANFHSPTDSEHFRHAPQRPPALGEELAPAVASQASFALAAVNAPQWAENIERLHQRAATGDRDAVRALAEWANAHQSENVQLRNALRRQRHDFIGLLEMVNATSARALDIGSLERYLLRSVSGHCAVAKVAIFRRVTASSGEFSCSAAQGLANKALAISRESALSRHAFDTNGCFLLRELAQNVQKSPDVRALLEAGLVAGVALVHQVDGRGAAVLEGFLFLGDKLTHKEYGRSDFEILESIGKMAAICLRNEHLYRLSIIDALTGIYSRGYFEAKLSQELQRIAALKNKKATLMMLDVDHFKRVNDTYGHPTGDRVLQALAEVLKDHIRNVDLVARYGGEEFAIIFAEVGTEIVREVARRLLNAVRAMKVLAPNGEVLHITASFGVASYPNHAGTPLELIQRADAALYRSKQSGRDRVTFECNRRR